MADALHMLLYVLQGPDELVRHNLCGGLHGQNNPHNVLQVSVSQYLC